MCPDDAAWERLEQRRAAATEAHAALLALLTELGTYQEARADGRYSSQANGTSRPAQAEPPIDWQAVLAHTEAIHEQIALRSQAGIAQAALELLRLVADPNQIVLPPYPSNQAAALIAEIRVLLEQQIDETAPTAAGFLRAVGRFVHEPPNTEEHRHDHS